MEAVDKILCCDRQNGSDPMAMAAMMNGGLNNQWNNPFIYLVWMMFARRMWGNVTPSTNFLTRLNLMKHFSSYVFQRIIGTMRSKEVPEAAAEKIKRLS